MNIFSEQIFSEKTIKMISTFLACKLVNNSPVHMITQASTLTQNGIGPVGPVTQRIYWLAKFLLVLPVCCFSDNSVLTIKQYQAVCMTQHWVIYVLCLLNCGIQCCTNCICWDRNGHQSEPPVLCVQCHCRDWGSWFISHVLWAVVFSKLWIVSVNSSQLG